MSPGSSLSRSALLQECVERSGRTALPVSSASPRQGQQWLPPRPPAARRSSPDCPPPPRRGPPSPLRIPSARRPLREWHGPPSAPPRVPGRDCPLLVRHSPLAPRCLACPPTPRREPLTQLRMQRPQLRPLFPMSSTSPRRPQEGSGQLQSPPPLQRSAPLPASRVSTGLPPLPSPPMISLLGSPAFGVGGDPNTPIKRRRKRGVRAGRTSQLRRKALRDHGILPRPKV